MSDQPTNYRIHEHMTRTTFLHVEDCLDFDKPKVKLFAGSYKKGNGADQVTAHYMDLPDALVLLNDLAWNRKVDYCEFKGGSSEGRVISRVLKVKSNGEKVWFRLESGPGEKIGAGAVKPKGEPTTIINIPFDKHLARAMAYHVLLYIQAWQTAQIINAKPTPHNSVNGLCPTCHTRPCICDDRAFPRPHQPNGYEQDADANLDQCPEGA